MTLAVVALVPLNNICMLAKSHQNSHFQHGKIPPPPPNSSESSGLEASDA